MLLIFDLQSCMASLISLIIGMEILVITLYRQLFHYFRVINNNDNNDNNNNDDGNDFNNNN